MSHLNKIYRKRKVHVLALIWHQYKPFITNNDWITWGFLLQGSISQKKRAVTMETMNYLKTLKGARVAPGGFGFRTLSSTYISNNKNYTPQSKVHLCRCRTICTLTCQSMCAWNLLWSRPNQGPGQSISAAIGWFFLKLYDFLILLDSFLWAHREEPVQRDLVCLCPFKRTIGIYGLMVWSR